MIGKTDTLMIECRECRHEFACEVREYDASTQCPECGAALGDSYMKPREQLPPFRTTIGAYGPEVLIGYEGTDGGRWAFKCRDDEESFRKLLQAAVYHWSADDDWGEMTDLEGFDRAVHFALSHSVNMGWHLYITKQLMAELEQLDATRRPEETPQGEDTCYVERIDRITCPSCKSDEVIYIENNILSCNRAILIEDGVIKLGESYGDAIHSWDSDEFRCVECEEIWPVPDRIAHLISWGS